MSFRVKRKAVIKNCLSIGSVQSAITGQFFGAVKSNKCSITNSFYQGANVNGSASTVTLNPQEVTLVTNEQLAGGAVAANLAPAFRQNIGKDACPVLDATHAIVAEITEAGYATLFIAETDLAIPENVTAYTGELKDDYLKLNVVDGKIAAGEPVVLKGTAGYYNFVPTTGATKAESNDLQGATEDIAATGKYVLAKPADKEVGFYQATTGTIKAGKAYIELDGTGPLVKALYFVEESETAIGSIQNSKFEIQNGEVYNLAGQKLSKLQKGVNIVSGRKVLF